MQGAKAKSEYSPPNIIFLESAAKVTAAKLAQSFCGRRYMSIEFILTSDRGPLAFSSVQTALLPLKMHVTQVQVRNAISPIVAKGWATLTNGPSKGKELGRGPWATIHQHDAHVGNCDASFCLIVNGSG
ncbi:hypothetical protein ACLOJK_016517 [Asimina triloba]